MIAEEPVPMPQSAPIRSINHLPEDIIGVLYRLSDGGKFSPGHLKKYAMLYNRNKSITDGNYSKSKVQMKT